MNNKIYFLGIYLLPPITSVTEDGNTLVSGNEKIMFITTMED